MHESRRLIPLALFSAVVVAVEFQIQGRIGFNLADEGFLWYGAQRVMLGEVPLRDFMSYDLGRYYWSAAIMTLMGDNGIMALRTAAAVFQVVGLFLALSMLAGKRRRSNAFLMLLAACTLLLWMFPRHKLFDITLSISLVAVLAYLIEKPSNGRFFLTGTIIGLVAIFGRNHGLYGAIGSSGVIIYLTMLRHASAPLRDAVKWWLSGIFVGYLPLLLALLLVPGLAHAFWDGIRFTLFEYKGTNLPLPVPWPWRVAVGQVSWFDSVRRIFVGLCFIGIIIYGVFGVAYGIREKLKKIQPSPVLVASAFMALPYAHFAFSRANISHLAQGIFPALIGTFALTTNRQKLSNLSVAFGLLVVTLFVCLPLQPGWQAEWNKNWTETKIAGDTLKIDPATDNYLKIITRLADEYSPDGRSFITAPGLSGAYAVLGRRSPMWEIYALFPRNSEFQEMEIQRIKEANPGFVMVVDQALDGREDLRFRNTHPLIDRYIRDNFESLGDVANNPALQVYKSKQTRP